MTSSRDAALANLEQARQNRQALALALHDARSRYRKAEAEEKAAQYMAIVSVPCSACHAEIGDPCFASAGIGKAGYHPTKRVYAGPYTQHGVRQDLSGVNGAHNRERQLAKVGS